MSFAEHLLAKLDWQEKDTLTNLLIDTTTTNTTIDTILTHHTLLFHRLRRKIQENYQPWVIHGDGKMKFDKDASRRWKIAECAAFCKVREANGLLSNMANGLGFTDPETGIRWGSSEAWYQAQRFPHLPEVQVEIREAPNAFMSKKVAYGYLKQSRADWTADDLNIRLMAHAIELKTTNPLFVEALLATGEKPILELRNGEKFWGASPAGPIAIGANVLGDLLVSLREKLGKR